MNLQGRDLKLGLIGDDVRLLHGELDQLGLEVPDAERTFGLFGAGTQQLIARFQKEHQLETTGVVEAKTAAAINQQVEVGVYIVKGTVSSPDQVGVGGLSVQIVDRNVGQDVVLATTATDQTGRYRVAFSAASLRQLNKAHPDLQVRVLAGPTALASSEVRYNASNRETLNVMLPANSPSLPSEFQTLTGTLSNYYQGRLRDLKESDGRQDITYLANKTGWDARAVALASLADQFAANAGGTNLKADLFYALFRAGLPANPDTLYQTDAATVEAIWKQAIAQGIISQSRASGLPVALREFQQLSAAHALTTPALTGTSTLQEMLQISLGNDAQRQQQFASLFTQHRGDLPAFWEAVGQAFGQDTARKLQLDGQLSYLTINNAVLVGRLHAAEPQALSSTLDLAQRGYYRADKWTPLLDGNVPDQIPGATADEKRANYAELLAIQVRLSFPTAAIAEQVRSEEIPLQATAPVRNEAVAFLTAHQGQFELGAQPIEQYLTRNQLGGQVNPSVVEQIKRLQRVYQITPNDQAMSVLMKHDLHSAYQITRYGEAEFVNTFKDEMGGEENARLTYAKSLQVHNAVLNIAISYLTMRYAPVLGQNTAAPVINSSPGDAAIHSDIVAYPTLEGLFGSMDFCGCAECRSILSPAAYLVDLLQFVDRPVNEKANPQEILLQRRPDIQHLPLTCENTNTPVPYIDLVNETLEYFVTNNLSLDQYKGHDTDDRSSAAELLASPQFVNDTAYDTLKAASFPPPLPFHRPLETLRRYFATFQVPLAGTMETLRVDDAVKRADDSGYGWQDILMEEIGLSRAEYTLLTDRTLTVPQLYGYPPGTPEATVLEELANVKTFARRVGVSYDEIVVLLATRFVNPSSAPLPRLDRLGLPFATLKALKDGTISDTDFAAMLPPGLDVAQYGGDIKAWVTNDANYARIMSLITIANPNDATGLCSFDQLKFRYANPDNSANALQAIDYVRLLRFIRLWKKLGWTIEQTDKAITALYPAAEIPTGADEAAGLQHLDAGFLALLPRLGIAQQIIDRLQLAPATDLPGLLACWAPIDSHGDESLYRRMFLSPTLPRQDSAFADDGFGNVLQDSTRKLGDHTETLRAAFNLTGDELSLILADLAFHANTPLTLENISAIYRRGWLARQLNLSLRELLLLSRFAGLDPFVPPDPPNPVIVRLARLVEMLRSASLKPVQALYLIWNQDISGKSAPADRETYDFARTLSTSLDAIERDSTASDPEVKRRRKQQQALVAASTATHTGIGFAQALLDNASVLHAATDTSQPALADLTALEDGGLSARFYWHDSATGTVDHTEEVVPLLSYAASSAVALPANPTAGSPISGIWSGYLDALENGDYGISIETDPGATVTLTIGGQSIELQSDNNIVSTKAAISLRAGTLVPIVLTVEKVTSTLVVRWEAAGSGLQIIPTRSLYPAVAIDRLRQVHLRFLKATSLATALKLTAAELAHAAADADLTIDGEGWLSRLPTAGSPDDATARALRDVLTALLDLARLKQALSPDDERLLTVLQRPDATSPDGENLLLALSGWEAGSLDALLARFNKSRADLAHLDVLRRVYDAFAVITAMRVPAAALLVATTNEPDAGKVQQLQSALRARYSDAGWLDVLKPINDDLRSRQRDALVAYVLQQLSQSATTSEIDTPNKLFEYFLMDVEIDPCTQTSRVRHALSSVQLFIERYLMNLEPEVAPSSINASQWEWMKRYRVWEANRKVFLWPENWLEPELRDDQSPFFKTAMSELLQGDITEERATTALLNYLGNLEEVAKLEPCGIYYAEGDPVSADDVAHVIARTAGAHRKYYYRRREHGSWTPWERIKLDIEDNPVMPVIWNDRLLLFWVRLLKETPVDPSKLTSSASSSTPLAQIHLADVKQDAASDAVKKKVTVRAVLCWSEYYNGKWQPAKTSDVNRPTTLGQFAVVGSNAFDRSKLLLSARTDGDTLVIRLFGAGGSFFILYNTHSLPVRAEDLVAPGMVINPIIEQFGSYRSIDTSGDTLSLTYDRGAGQLIWPGHGWSHTALSRNVLKNAISDGTIEPRHALRNVWDAPFFYHDGRHVFYVTTTEKLVMIREFNGFGVAVQPSNPVIKGIPRLIQKPDPLLTTSGGGNSLVRPGIEPDAVDLSPIARFVTEDAYIRTALDTTTNIRFGDLDIGPSGIVTAHQVPQH